MEILSNEEKKILEEKLEEQFGIEKLKHTIINLGKNKYRIYSGNLSKDMLLILDKELKIETIGLYFAKEEIEGIRLTIDGVLFFKNDIKKNIIEINDELAKEWLEGKEIYIKEKKGYLILKNKDDFLGCGKSSGEKITNFVPKERRIKKRTNF